ncbi:MAG TPA: hypothetical protein VGF75_05445 [Candidatus Saccharimonadales bacterium]
MRTFRKWFLITAAIFVLVLAQFAFVPKALAGTLTTVSLNELGSSTSSYTNEMIAGDYQYFGIGFTPATTITAGNASIEITLPAGFTVATSGQTVSTTDPVSGYACNASNGVFGSGVGSYSLPGGLTIPSQPSGQTITIDTTSQLTNGTSYCLFDTYASAIKNPSAGTYNVTIGTYNSAALVDSQTIGVQVLSSTCGSGSNQNCNSYTVTATINPTFSMSLSTYSDALGSLSATAPTESTGVTTTISTNARTGWFIWASDANGGLLSASAGGGSCPGSAACIASVTANTAYDFSTSGHYGTNEYGLGVSTFNTTPYQYTGGACTATHFCGAGLSKSAFYMIASSGTYANAVTFTSHEIADISATSPPGGDYADTINLIGCGSF